MNKAQKFKQIKYGILSYSIYDVIFLIFFYK